MVEKNGFAAKCRKQIREADVMENIKKKHLLIGWFIMVALAMFILIVLQYYAFTEYNEIRAFKDAKFFLTETEKIIAGNDQDRESLNAFLKNTCLKRAKSVSYVLESEKDIEKDPQKMQKLAQTLGLDQIHLFDPEGRMFGGTNPEYYGLTLDAGSQIRFFKPMLEDKTLELSQDVTPNTAEGLMMLYSMCWNQDGTMLIQTGILADRFPRLSNRNRIDMFLSMVPNDPARDIILTDTGSSRIVASSDTQLIGRQLTDLGIAPDQTLTETPVDFKTGIPGNPIYCSAERHKDYDIYIAQYKKQIDENIPVTLFTFSEYLVLVFIAMSFIIDYYYDKFIQEKTHAMRDKLTGLYSRRAYETDLEDLDEEDLDQDLVFIAMDVNGLKGINDSRGHQAGDLLLQGAALCMQDCFCPYGKVYRFGGDEFAAIILAKDLELLPLEEHLQSLCRDWSAAHGLDLSISLGFARSAVYPDAGIHALESYADQEMYANKSRYYASGNHNRRGVFNEGK